MWKRKCASCGTDISSKPRNHYLCYDCWKRKNKTYSFSNNSYYDENYKYKDNETYYQRYIGDSEYDLGPDWDYDEFPPENL